MRLFRKLRLPESAQLIKFGSEIEIEHSKKQTDAQVVPDLVAPLPLNQKSSNKNDQEPANEIDQSSMVLNFPLGWNKGKKPDLKRLEKVRGVMAVSYLHLRVGYSAGL